MIRWINNLKGFGILLVVLGHLLPREEFGKWIYSFHLPLFFYISGYLYSIKPQGAQTVWGGVKKAFIRLMCPFYFWSYLCLLINFVVAVIWCQEQVNLLVRYTVRVTLGGGQNGLRDLGLSLFPLWFIPPLFCTKVLLIIVRQYIKKESVRIILLLSLSVIGVCLFYFDIHIPYLPYRLDVAFISIPFVLLGVYHNKLYKKLKRPSVGLILVCIGTISSIINSRLSPIGTIEIVDYQISNPFLFYFSAINLCSGFFILFETIIKESSVSEFFGNNSMIVMAFHFPILFWIQHVLSIDFFSQFLFVCVILCVVILLINRFIPFTFDFRLIIENENSYYSRRTGYSYRFRK